MASEPGIGVPVACGAIGDFDPDAVARVAAELGAEVAEVHRDQRSILLLDRQPSRWRGGDKVDWGLAWCERVPDRSAAASSWQEAASHGACGMVIDGDRRILHASASGVAPLYWIRAGAAVYFATRVDALAWARLGSLSPDWEAWASILTVAYPYEGRTPFSEIKRLLPLGTVTSAPGREPRLSSGGLDWLERDRIDPSTAAEAIVAGLRAEVEALGQSASVHCPLTGGWDSRLLACLLAEAELLECAYTVDTGLGDDRDERLAGAVAARLGVRHQTGEPSTLGYLAELESAARLLEYQSLLHLPIHRLVARMPEHGPSADGLAGDVLIKALLVDDEILAAPNPRATLFDRAISPKKRLGAIYVPTARRALRRSTRAAFLRTTERFEDHPAAATLSVYWTRTHRTVSLSPAAIVGARHELMIPFVATEVAAPAIAAAPADKLGGRLYRRVLELVNPEVAALPSTNDGPSGRSLESSRHASGEARAAHHAILRRSRLRPWFAPPLARMVEAGALGLRYARQANVTAIQAICSFTLWSERYRDLIGEPDPGELFR